MPKRAERIASVPPYLFAEIDKKKAAAIARGVDVISLGIGDPDMPTPKFVVDKMKEAVENPKWHQYPDYDGSLAYRTAVTSFYKKRFGVELDPKTEALALIGSKEGLAHIIWAYIDAGDIALVPDPAYPVYKTHTLLAGGTPYIMPLVKENNFLPDLQAIPEDVARKAKIMFIDYPNNPTGAVATLDFYREAVAFARKYDILLVSDNAYSEMTYDGFKAPSVFEVEGAKEIAVEFWSLSKPFNMTGWRIAAVVGNAQAISALGIIKTNTDSGQFTAIQEAAIEALTNPAADQFIAEMNEIYTRRRDIAVAGLRAAGLDAQPMKGSFYLWVPVPAGHTSASFAALLLDEAGVIVTPGAAYGAYGEGFVRLSLCLKEERLVEALGRIRAACGGAPGSR
ncbi:MAG: LL-diaminopimelate aminotransferase apoenzyme [Symbiobacteriaceae bacterium]|nr:LL-diaminopimelate aminotransferase apoenzyme [Symbiobacteriaceae bacterium]